MKRRSSLVKRREVLFSRFMLHGLWRLTAPITCAIITAMTSRSYVVSLLIAAWFGLSPTGCAGAHLQQPTIAPSERSYQLNYDAAWDHITNYITSSGLGIREQDHQLGLIVTDYVYERNALGMISARYRNYYRILPEENGSRIVLTVVSEDDPETNGQWRDITAPEKAAALSNTLWEVLDPLLSGS